MAADGDDGLAWVDSYAASYGAWPHQVEALRHALARNVVLNIPTGTGKTLVACMLLDMYKAQASSDEAQNLFVVASRALVGQQAEYLRRTSRQGLQVAELGGNGQLCVKPDVVVGTAEVLRLALERGQILFTQIQVAVFDEAHYAVGKHPYAELLDFIKQTRQNPRILGLTASFLHGALVDVAGKREALEERLLGADLIAPQVRGPRTEHQFFKVPWSGPVPTPQVIAELLERTDQFLGQLQPSYSNWQFQTALEKERPRTRGVVEGLGELGWRIYMREGLPEVLWSKLNNKLSFAENEEAKASIQAACAGVSSFQADVCQLVAEPGWAEPTTGKCEALVALLTKLLGGDAGGAKALVFVERVSVARPLACILNMYLGVPVVHVCGVQAMDDATRRQALKAFASGMVQVLVATASLEEGLDVPDCKYVIRYDFFASAKSHVQGAGRARHPEAQVFYFENDPLVEQERREVVEAVARGQEPQQQLPFGKEGLEQLPQQEQEKDTKTQAPVPGIGSGHAWGEESTMWDYYSNVSFRGLSCACGARIHIASKSFGRGGKKKERRYSLEGPTQCPRFDKPLDPRLKGIDPATGILQTSQGQG